MKTDDVREKFLSFFEGYDHLRMRSDTLVPTHDETLLFTGAGMNQFKDQFLGRGRMESRRVCTSQKCLRTGDIENVGVTASHHTFFEMLGNFSFGDYFKRESIEWGWELVTGSSWYSLPESKLSVSVYETDEEAYGIWRDVVGLSESKIYRFGEHDNYWPADAPSQSPPGTLCGPCTEIFFDQGEAVGCGKPGCNPSCDCDRYVEIWNHVFQQYEKQADGSMKDLPQQNIDTGAGLERIAAVLQGVPNNFEIDSLLPVVEEVARISERSYGADLGLDRRMRRITDHVRAVAFCIGDGVLPSNSERGYVLRRLLRRAVLDGRALGIGEPFCYTLVPLVAKLMPTYPDVTERRENISRIVKAEEEKFGSTLAQGMQVLEESAGRLKKGASLDGAEAFRLYDTYGFPLELTAEMLSGRGVSVDREGFEREMAAARERSRAGSRLDADIFGSGPLAQIKEITHGTEFVGYETSLCEAKVLAVISGDEIAEEATEGAEVEVVVDRTPFYGEAGGQVGDTGTIEGPSGTVAVSDTVRAGGIFLHRGEVTKGAVAPKQTVTMRVDAERRENIARNHTATHLLHHRLRHILGKHVEQSGSLVTPDRLRLDFSHFEAMTPDEIDRVEELVNRDVRANGPVETKETGIDEAKQSGAMALFGEKYGDTVRLVSTELSGEVSRELCGGTHLERTGKIGLFKIVSEGAIAAGFRRIEAVTGPGAYELVRGLSRTVDAIAARLKVPRDAVRARVEELAERNRELERELQKARAKAAGERASDAATEVKEVAGVRYAALNMGEATADEMRTAADALRAKLGSGVVLLGAAKGGKALLLCAVTDDLVKEKGLSAGRLIGPVAKVVGGGGGGRPQMAQAGGKDPSKLPEALEGFGGMLEEQVG